VYRRQSNDRNGSSPCENVREPRKRRSWVETPRLEARTGRSGIGASRPLLRVLVKVRLLNRPRTLSLGGGNACSCPQNRTLSRPIFRVVARCGKIAVANAKLAYQSMKRILTAQRSETLRSQGARPQRLLWASTSTKKPDYPDLMYVELLIGPMTISTMPEQTIAAVLDHGNIVAGTIEQGMEEAREVMEHLDSLGIRFADVAARLERVGVQQFAEAFDKSINAIKKNPLMMSGDCRVTMTWSCRSC